MKQGGTGRGGARGGTPGGGRGGRAGARQGFRSREGDRGEAVRRDGPPARVRPAEPSRRGAATQGAPKKDTATRGKAPARSAAKPAGEAPRQPTRRQAKAATTEALATGVQTLTVDADEADMRVDRFLTARFPQLAFTHIQ